MLVLYYGIIFLIISKCVLLLTPSKIMWRHFCLTLNSFYAPWALFRVDLALYKLHVLLLLADLPVSQFLLIAIINGGTQWACVCMGAAIVPQEIFEFVTIKIFQKFHQKWAWNRSISTLKMLKISGCFTPERNIAYSPTLLKKILSNSENAKYFRADVSLPEI